MFPTFAEPEFYFGLLIAFWVLAGFTAVSLLFLTAPYGRYTRKGYGLLIGNTLGWVLMEVPATVLPALSFLWGQRRDTVLWVFFLLWQLHYVHRAFIFPFRRRGGGTMPLLVVAMALVFNLGNAYLNWRYLTVLGPTYDPSWLTDPRFLVGTGLFAMGFVTNQHADWVLLHLRKPGETGYKIPQGFLYRYISCPNYFGELLEWTGWAILTWSLGGLTFAVFTAANLVPRALSHHRDYHRRFPAYPAERRAVIPFVL